MKLPLNLKIKSNQKNLRIIAISTLLVLGSILFLLTGPEVFNLVESKVSSGNLEEAVNFTSSVLAETTPPVQTPKIQIVSSNIEAPKISAVSALAFDVETNQLLFQKNINQRLALASTTKIMTAIIASEHFTSADILTVPTEAIVGGSSMELSGGERLTFRSLLYGMMLNSGNDAAFTIAMNYPGGYDAFVSKMNGRVLEMGLKDTHFDNPAGFDSPTNYSSAYDLLQIGIASMQNVKLGRVFSTKETSVTSIDKTQIHVLKNLNKLLSQEGVVGIKTGTTEKAGESFVGLVEKNSHTILIVVLNSNDRFGETKELIDWIFTNYSWQVN
ncbi:D-alanyl-D-alanine carboxypeptidase [Candidatus Daviesbacteria bacterium]|nr:D-alanyl-D-alanine carboxypeptidase [Candidatus Daviesbacteria bacterium]